MLRARLLPHACLLACLLALAGCGGGGDATGGENPRNRGGLARGADPVPTESIEDAIRRIQGAVTASGCEAVRGLVHSTYGEISDDACRAVRAELGAFREPRGATYGSGAAIDFRTGGGRRRTIALALDGDGTYRIDFVLDVPQLTVGTAKPAAFDRNAAAVVRAMQTGDCDAFLRLVSRTMGLGTGPDREVCRRVSDAPLRRELVADRRARPVSMGGNAWLAFYRLRARRGAYYTMVMAREDAGGSPRHVLVNALPAG